MKRALLLVSMLAVAGCFNPDDILPISGQAVSTSGVEGLTVELLRATSSEFGDCEDLRPFKTTTTDAEGKFSFDVFRAQSQSLSRAGAFCFEVRLAFASGTVASTQLAGIFSPVDVAPLRDWVPDARLENGAIRFEPMSSIADAEDAGDTLTHRATFFTSDGGLAWVSDDLFLDPSQNLPFRTELAFDPLVVEDLSGELELSAVLSPAGGSGPFGGSGGPPVRVVAGQRLRLEGTTAPPSRGAGCPAVGVPCPLTDGVFEPSPLGRMSLTVELGAAQRVSTVALRELELTAPIFIANFLDADGGVVATRQVSPELSLRSLSSVSVRRPRDGGTPTFNAVPATWVLFHVDAGVPVKTLQLQFPSGAISATEVSLY